MNIYIILFSFFTNERLQFYIFFLHNWFIFTLFVPLFLSLNQCRTCSLLLSDGSYAHPRNTAQNHFVYDLQRCLPALSLTLKFNFCTNIPLISFEKPINAEK